MRKRELPKGKARELEKALEEEEKFALFEKVKNEVIWVNPEIKLPFKIKEQEENPLGVFLKLQREGNASYKKLETIPGECRTALLGRVIFKDKNNNYFRDIDLKGIGDVCAPSLIGQPFAWFSYHGFLSREDAEKEKTISEELTKAKIRVPRVLAIIKLKEAIFKNKKISIEELLKETPVPENFQPVVMVRSFRTKAKVENLFSHSISERIKNLLLEDAKEIVRQETGKKELSNKDYLMWFSQTLGENLGRLHKMGYCHFNLHHQNLTLACELVDFDTVEKFTQLKEREKDLDGANKILKDLGEKLGVSFSLLKEKFKEGYERHFQREYQD